MFEKIVEILSDFTEVEVDKIQLNSNLIADLELNSLDVINVVVAFEEEFDIEIPDGDIKNLTTISDIIRYLEENME